MCIATVGYSQFQPRNVIDSNATGITDIITADINNDNVEDIVVSQKFVQNNKISYYLNQGDGSFENQQLIDTSINFPLGVSSGDLDGNGWNDIVTFSGASNDGDLLLYMNNSGMFSSRVIVDSNLYHCQDVKVGDIDIDNDEDIVMITDTALIVYYNEGGGSYSKNVVPPGITTEYYAMELEDIDSDGFKDIVVGGVKTIIYKNVAGNISFDSLRTSTIPDNNHLVFLVHLNDFDNDGDFDLVTDKNTTNVIKWYSNDGSGNFSAPMNVDSDVSQCFSITSADYDNDGDEDLFTALPQLGELVWYKNDGSGNFGSRSLVYQGNIPFTKEVCSDDLNNDGLPDVIWAQELSVHLNSEGLKLQNLHLGHHVEIYPNPTFKSLSIVVKEESVCYIQNSSGQAVFPETDLIAGSNTLELDLKPGVYLITIVNEKYSKQNRLIVK